MTKLPFRDSQVPFQPRTSRNCVLSVNFAQLNPGLPRQDHKRKNHEKAHTLTPGSTVCMSPPCVYFVRIYILSVSMSIPSIQHSVYMSLRMYLACLDCNYASLFGGFIPSCMCSSACTSLLPHVTSLSMSLYKHVRSMCMSHVPSMCMFFYLIVLSFGRTRAPQ